MENEYSENKAAHPVKEFVVYVFIAALYCTAIVTAVLSPTLVYFTWLQVAGLSAFILSILYLAFYNKITISITGLFVALSTVFLLLFSQFFEPAAVFLDQWKTNFNDIYKIVMGARYQASYAFLITLLVCFGVALLTTIFMRKFFNFIFLSFFGLSIFVIEIILNKLKSPLSFFLYLFVVAILFVARTHNRDSRLKRKNANLFSGYAFYTIPMCLAAVVLAYFIASPFREQPGPLIANASNGSIKSARDIVDFLLPANTFHFTRTGFSGTSGKLGGDILLDHTPVMKVASDKKLYLKGATKEIYDGTMWVNDNSAYKEYKQAADYEYTEMRLIDKYAAASYTNNSNASLIDIPNNNFTTEYYTPLTFTVYPLLNQMATMFHPLNALNFQTESKLSANSLGDKKFDPPVQANGSYTITYLDMNQDNMEYFLSRSEKGIYRKNGISESDLPGVSVHSFYEYVDSIYERYTVVPDTLPERVFELAQTLTAEKKSNFSKVKALEDYLKTLTYTLSPGDVLNGYDFVDHFLFETQKGYCTYFATSLCIMARTLGIPARYVEGFVTPSSKTDNVYVVTNAQAHAWVEVYFEGAGWVQFEPTPAYSSSFYINEETPVNIAPEMENNPEYQAHLEEAGTTNTVNKKTEEPESNNGKNESVENPKSFAAWVMPLLIFTGVVFAACNIVFWYRCRKKQRYLNGLKSDSANRSSIGYFREMEKLAGLEGNGKFPHETPMQYSARCTPIYQDIFDFKAPAEIYAKALYSNCKISKEERRIMHQSYYALRKKVREAVGLPKYIFRYIFCD